MATTFAVVPFKNRLLNWLSGTGSADTVIPIYGAIYYNGAQAATPETTPAGSLNMAVANASLFGTKLSGNFAAADNNADGFVQGVATARSGSGSTAITAVTTARICDSASVATVDTPVGTTAASGVGIVIDSVNFTGANGPSCSAFNFRLPISNGSTLSLSLSLARRLVDLCTGIVGVSASTIPQFGINTNGACTITVYAGTAPTTADTALSGQTVLCVFTVGAAQLWAAASAGGIATSTVLTSAAAANSGTASFFRMVKTNGTQTYTLQGSVGDGVTPGDFNLNTKTIVATTTYTLNDIALSL